MGLIDRSVGFTRAAVVLRYSVAATATLFALGVGLALDPILRNQALFLPFIVAVMVASYLGGRGPGILAAITSLLAVDWFFVDPRDSFSIKQFDAIAASVFFFGVAISIALLIGKSKPSPPPPGDSGEPVPWAPAWRNRQHTIWFGAAVAILIVEAGLFFGAWNRFSERERWSIHSYQAIQKIAAMLSTVQDAEAASRAFVVTGQDPYLQQYATAVGKIPAQFADFRAWTADNPRQQAQLRELETVLNQKLAVHRQCIELRRKQGLASAIRPVATGEGKELMDRARAILDAMTAEEQTLLAERSARAGSAARGMGVLMGSGAGMLVLLLLAGARAINRGLTERNRAEQALRDGRNRLQLAVDGSGGAEWEIPADPSMPHGFSDCMTMNPRLKEFIGFSGDEFPDSETAWLGHIHPDDLPAVRPDLEGCRQAQTALAQQEYRVEHPDGSWRWIYSSRRPYCDGSRQPAHWAGMGWNITEREPAENALRESRARLEAALASMTDAVCISDGEGRFVEFNEAFAAFHNFRTKDECPSMFAEYPGILDVFLRDGTPAPVEMWAVARALRGERATNAEYRLRRKDTGEEWIGGYSFAPIKDASGRVVGSVVVARDITEQRRAEEALESSEKRYRTLFESMSEAVILQEVVTDERGGAVDLRYLAVNPAFERQTGLKPAQFVGHTALEMFPEFVSEWLARFENMVRTGALGRYEDWFAPLGRWFDSTLFPTEPGQFWHILQDITERKRAEDALRESVERLEKVLKVETVGVMFWDMNTGCMVDANDAFLKMMGYSRSQVESRELRWQDLTPPDYMDVSRAEVEKFLATGRVGPYEKEYFRKDGTRKWLVFAGSSLGNNQCVEFCVDISARKSAEAALRESEERLRLTIQVAQIGSFEWDLEQQAAKWSPELEALYGLPPGSYYGGYEQWAALIHPEDLAEAERQVRKSHETGTLETEYRVVRSDGAVRWMAARGRVIKNGGGEPVRMLGVNLDITDRKQAERAWRESEERLRLATEAAKIGAFNLDLRTGENTWTPELEALYGLGPGEFGRTQPSWEQLVHPDDRAAAVAKTAETLQTGEPVEHEWRVVWPDGTVHWIAARFQGIRDEAGNPVRLTGVNIDVTERKRADEQLRASEERFRSLALATSHAIWRIGPDGRVTPDYPNASWEKFTGQTAEQMSGLGWLDAIHPDDSARVAEVWQRALETKSSYRTDYRLRRHNGEYCRVEARGTPILNEDGSVREWVCASTDIDDRTRAEQELRNNEARQSFLVTLSDALRPLTDAREIQFVASRILGEHLRAGRVGYAECEGDGDMVVVGRHYADGMPSVAGRHRRSDYGTERTWDRRSGRAVVRCDIANDPELTAEQKESFAALSLAAMADVPLVKAGRLAAVLFVHYPNARTFSADELTLIEDVAERTWAAVERARAEEALHESQERFRLAQELSPDGFTILRPIRNEDGSVDDFIWIYENDAIARMNGTDTQAVRGRRVLDLFPSLGSTEIFAVYQEVVQTGERRVIEAEYQSESMPAPLWFRLAIVPAGDDIAVLAQNITKRKAAEEELTRSEERFRSVYENAATGIAITDWDGHLQQCNPAYLSMLGYTIDELRGRSFSSLVHEEDRAENMAKLLELQDGQRPSFEIENRYVRKDGQPIMVHKFVSTLPDRTGKPAYMFALVTDITLRKRAEAALLESEHRFRTLFESMQEAFMLGEVIFDESGKAFDWRFLEVNPYFETIYGLKREEVIGKTYREVLPGSHSEDWIEAAGRVTLSGQGEPFVRESNTGRHLEGTLYRPHPGQFAAIVVDATARREAERQIRQLNAELEDRVRDRTAQLEAANKELEAFAYSVSHDLRAPLRGIDGWSLALVEDYGGELDHKALDYLSRVRSEAQRMGSLIDDMLQLSRLTRSQMERQQVDLTALANVIGGRLSESHPDRRIEFVISPGLTGEGDPGLLGIALSNLFDNAVKFTGPREIARIEFGSMDRDGEFSFFVRDNGVGFNMATAGKLFSAFHRLHKASQFPGSGVGLATVQRVIRRHGGRVWAEAERDAGATFYFTLDSQ